MPCIVCVLKVLFLLNVAGCKGAFSSAYRPAPTLSLSCQCCHKESKNTQSLVWSLIGGAVLETGIKRLKNFGALTYLRSLTLCTVPTFKNNLVMSLNKAMGFTVTQQRLPDYHQT